LATRKSIVSDATRHFRKRTLDTSYCDVERSGRASDIGQIAHLRFAHLRFAHLRFAHLGLATVIVMALLLGCGGDPAVAPIDGGVDAGGCMGAVVCDGLLVKACDNKVVGATVADCSAEGGCSDGRCVSPDCATVERERKTFAGCRFYTVAPSNVASDADARTSFLITNPGSQSAIVSLEQRVNGSWQPEVPMTVSAGGTVRMPVAGVQVGEGGGQQEKGGLRLSSDRPVTVAQIQSDDVNRDAQSSGGTMLLPVNVLGTHYMVMTYPQAQTPEIASLTGSPSGAGRLLIVGTQPETMVTLKLSPTSSGVVFGTLPSLSAGAGYTTLPLGDGEVFQVLSGNPGDDLSGTEITTSQPVAVFSGNMTTTYGRTADNLHSPDMAHEQMPPVFAWSHNYVAAALPPQQGACDTLLGQSGASLWRLVVASDRRSQVDIVGPSESIFSGELEPGEVMQLTRVGDFYVTSKEPLLMTQGIDCEPSLSLAISADKSLDDLTFAVLPFFDQVAAVARKGKNVVTLDGVVIPDSMFTPAGGGFEVARVPLPDCAPSLQVCTHRLHGLHGMTMRGMDIASSYALTAPAWGNCLDPFHDSCPS
jgi:hypothetical protein